MHRRSAFGRLAFLAGALLAGPAAAQRPIPARCEAIQIRVVDEKPRGSAQSYVDPITGDSYVLTDAVVLDGRAMQDVYAESFVGSPGDTVWNVVATVKPASADSLSAIGGRLFNRHVAVLIGDEVLQTSIVKGPLHTFVPLRIGASKTIADSLVLRVRRAVAAGCSSH